LKPHLTGTNVYFGLAVAADQDTVAVGATHYEGAGAVFVFVRDGHGWREQAMLTASNAESGDVFGWAVAISGDTIVVGAINEASGSTGVNGDQHNNDVPKCGAAYVFVRAGNAWRQEAYLKPSHPTESEDFGYSVTIEGDTVAVGAIAEDSGIAGDPTDTSAPDSGATYVFARTAGAWLLQSYLKPAVISAGANFGHSVSLSADTLAVGAVHEGSSATGIDGNPRDTGAPSSGAAYVFRRTGETWSQESYVKASNTGTNDLFGDRVGVSGDVLVVSAPMEDSRSASDPNSDDVSNSGAAYVFARSGNTWRQEALLKASNPDVDDSFGYYAAIDGERIAISTWRESSAATGVDGDQSDNSAPESGAVYAFARAEGVWQQRAYIKAQNAEAHDQFGISVAVSGDLLVAGAIGEDSNARDVDGNENDNSAESNGAAYVIPWP
jgi:hypothetical protein